jgi:hypothetical protein
MVALTIVEISPAKAALQHVFDQDQVLAENKPISTGSAWQARRSSVLRSPDRGRKPVLTVTATAARLATFAPEIRGF